VNPLKFYLTLNFAI